MPNSPPPPTYEEAVLCSVDPHLRQNHSNHKKDHPPPRQPADNPASEPPKLVLSSVASSHPSLTYIHEDNPLQPCVLDLSHTPIEVNFTDESDSRNYINNPAIIIHSAISTPGDDECPYYDKFTSSSKNSPVNEQQAIHKEKHNNKAPIFPMNIKEQANTTKADIELNITDRIKKDNNGGDISYRTITKDNSSVIYANEVTDWKRGTTEPCVDCRKANRCERRQSAASDFAKTNNVGGGIICITSRGIAQPWFYSHDSLIRKHHEQNILQNNEISNSMDADWSQMDRRRADICPYSSSMRQRSDTLDGTSMPFKQNFKQISEDNSNTIVLMPTRSNFSKSYNDLSNRQQVTYHRDSFCGGNMYKCQQCYCTSASDCRCPITSKSQKQDHLSNGRAIRCAEENRINKHHLLPEARNGHGGRGIRSVSVGDVRMRGGTDEYEWKDGKVQLKNGKISHGESVRYVWKDGHVEKITSDANNEDTQVEIIEASDSKACSKINPVFVCVILLAVIAVVVIIPVFFST